MDSSCKSAMAAAVAGGYMLGRTKKAKLAVGLVMFVAGRRLKLAPADLAAAGVRQVSGNVELGALGEQLRDELFGAVKSAAGAAVDRQVASMVNSLRERTGVPSEAGPANGDESQAGDGDGDGHGDGDGGGDENRAEDEQPEKHEEPDKSSPKRQEATRHRSEQDGSRRASSSPDGRRRPGHPAQEPKRAPAKRASSQHSTRSGR